MGTGSNDECLTHEQLGIANKNVIMTTIWNPVYLLEMTGFGDSIHQLPGLNVVWGRLDRI